MVEKIHVKDRDIVVPGDLLAEGMSYIPGGKAYRENSKIFTSTVGLASVRGRVVKVIPLSGRYMPKKGDVVIGTITNIGNSGWAVDIFAPYNADLNIGEATTEYIDLHKTELSSIFNIDDYVLAEVVGINERKFIKLSTKHRPCRKLIGGNLISVSPTKIPRIIGKEGSMISMLKQGSGCDILVGQNGFVWIKGDPEKQALAAKVINKIEDESHKKGLTDEIKKMLEKGG
jgi:exosome complex component RRP4